MNVPPPPPPPRFGKADMRLVWTALALLAAAKLWFVFAAGPLPDEAYYWLWGQRPDWSYFDHPPLQAWLQGAVSAIFGHSRFALRLPALLTTLVDLALIAWWVRRLADAGRDVPFPAAAAVFFASPVVFVYSTLVFHDHLMIALLGIAAIAFAVAFERAWIEARDHPAALWAAGLAVGLAALTKYNAALFGVAAALAVVLVPRFRLLLRSPHLWGAGLLALACLAPVFWWNAGNDNASFQYNLVDRLSMGWSARMTVEHVLVFTLLAVLTAGPFLMPAVLRLAKGSEFGVATMWRPLALSALVLSTLACLSVAFLGPVQFYWNLPAWVAFLPWAALLMSGAMLRGHLIAGMVVAAAFCANYAVLPLAALFGPADQESAMVYGWSEVAARVEAERAARGADFLLATDYRSGAILAFETGDARVEVISGRRSQFDLWRDEAALAGKDALILSDDWHPLDAMVAGRFAAVEPVAEVPVVRFGRTLKTYFLHAGRGYAPAGP
jgi:4-amino-4-deoxy-L-arabinose transferase-like glycosyltransferase